MAEGDILSGRRVKIWIEEADSTATDLSNLYNNEATNFDVSGGEEDVESEAVFGGFIDLEQPQAQFEISMDVVLRFGSNSTRWDALNNSTTKKMICVEARDKAGTLFYWNAYNNVSIINFDKEFEAEGEWRGTMTFKLSPTDADGNSNVQYGNAGTATDATDGVQAWS